MKVGDLVRPQREHPCKKMGIVVSLAICADGDNTAKVAWGSDWGTYWDFIRKLEVVSESR